MQAAVGTLMPSDDGDRGCVVEQQAAAVTIQTAWREWRLSGSRDRAAVTDFWTVADDPEAADTEADDEAEESAPPTLTTSGYMTNSVSSCFSELRASHTQDSLLPQLPSLVSSTASSAATTAVSWRRDADSGEEAEAEAEVEVVSERAQWMALERRLAELAAAREQRRRITPWRHYHYQQQQQPPQCRTHEESERERVLRALSSCHSEDELPEEELFSSGGGGGGGGDCELGPGLASAAPSAPAGMEVCFRNDAASDDEAPQPEANRRTKQKWQRFRRPPKNFVPSAATELTRPMQLCFISDPTSEEDDVIAAAAAAASATSVPAYEAMQKPPPQELQPPPPPPPPPPAPSPPQQPQPPVRHSRRPLEPELLASLGLGPDGRSPADDDDDTDSNGGDVGGDAAKSDLRRRQVQLQAEAQLALAQAEPMARMQLEVERHMRDLRNRDDLAELLGVASSRRLGESCLRQMSQGALQLVHNSLLARIEGHNCELVRCLMERDELHMEQDSMLVEIEDLTRRAQEAEAGRRATAKAEVVAADAPVATTSRPATQVRRRVSLLTARLKPNKLVSLFTGT